MRGVFFVILILCQSLLAVSLSIEPLLDYRFDEMSYSVDKTILPISNGILILRIK